MLKIPELSVPQLLAQACKKFPDRPAITDEHRTVTYTELYEEVQQLAQGLLTITSSSDVPVVGIEFENCIEFIVSFHAALAAGKVALPLTPSHREIQLAEQSPEVVLNHSTYHSILAKGHRKKARLPLVNTNDLAVLPYTSGTTALPKAVELTHHNLVANIHQFAALNVIPSPGNVYCCLPFSHIYGLTVLANTPLHVGAHIFAKPYQRETFAADHRAQKMHVTFIVPILAQHMIQHAADYPQLGTLICGASPLRTATAQQMLDTFGVRVLQGYGMTETSPVTHFVQRETSPLNGIGDPLPLTEQRIVDPETMLDAEIGELWVKGPQVMRGYMFGGNPCRDGWFRTGDIVSRAEDGSIVVVDRMKDLIKYHGNSISPAKLESIIAHCPGVVDCAVIRGYDQSGEEIPVAVVVGKATAAEIEAYVADRVPAHERLRQVRFVSEIPRTPSGKILKRQLEQQS